MVDQMFVIHLLLLVNVLVHTMHISAYGVNVAVWPDWPRHSIDPV